LTAQREWFEKDYYKVLGVSDTATQKEITRAYRKLARENHPDAKPGDAAAEERFKEVSAAYDVVGDAEKRKEYDEVRSLGPMGGFGGPMGGGQPGGGFGPGGFSFTTEDFGGGGGGIGDILGNLFGRGRAAGPSRGTGPQRGADLEAELSMDFQDAVQGITTTLHLTSEATCHVCNGSGAEAGSAPLVCPTCGGRGVIDDNQGMFSLSRPCPQCAGRGTIVENPCHNCHGSGVERRPREVKVRIPAGVTDGQRIRLKGRGGPGRNGGPPGDLYVTALVEPDDRFGIDGKNLTLTVPVTFAEAALGADITVPTIDGGKVKLRLPAGTRNGRTFRVKGRGVRSSKGSGDLLVTVEVAVPAKLSAAERKAVEALAAAGGESPRAHLGVEDD
jgi:molecular chaperone DnaJ